MKRPAFWLLCACWLAILLAPPLRRMLFIQLSGQSSVYKSWLYGPFPWSPRAFPPEKVRERFPNDPRVLAMILEDRKFNSDAEARINLHKYDALIRRFPRENWLLVRRLQKTLLWMNRPRLGGVFDDASWQANRAAGIPSPEKSKKPLNYTPQNLQNALEMARLGQKREPDNAFFDWVLFYLLMMNWRDEEAWQVLLRASHKIDYNRHEREWKQAQIAVHELELARSLLFEEKISVWIDSDMWIDSDIGVNGNARALARIVEWEGLKAARRRGDHGKALQIYTNFARLEGLHARHSYSALESMNARSLIGLALGVEGKATHKELSPQHVDSLEAWARVSAYKFARYATKHGRPDLAREMAQLRISGGQLQDKMRANWYDSHFFFGMPVRPLINALTSWEAAGSLLLSLTVLGALWLMLAALLHILVLPSPSVAHRDLMRTVGIAILWTVLCFGIALRSGLGWQTRFMIGTGNINVMESRENLSCLLLAGVILPPVLVSLWCWAAMLQRAKRYDVPNEAPPLWRDRLREVRFMPLVNGIALLLLLVGSLLWWMAVMVKSGGQIFFPAVMGLLPPGPGITIAEVHPLWPLSLFAVSLLALWARPIFGATAREKSFIAYRLRWLHQSLGALCVLGSVAYFLLLAVSVPLRATADAQMDQLLQRGEVELITGDSDEAGTR